MAKTAAVDALTYLSNTEKHPAAPVCAIYGDEVFLKREVIAALRSELDQGADSEFSVTSFAGKDVEWRDVRDAVCTSTLFGGGRPVVFVDDADSFVSNYRGELEGFVAKPAAGVLILDVKTWPGNTRLAKAVAASGLAIECKPPNESRAKRWLAEHAQREHGVRLEPAAADGLWELLPPELGILQQEVARLALLAGERRSIDVKLVQDHVGGWRTRTAWEMIDATADGNAQAALTQLDRLLAAGEQPIGLLAQMASSLRRLAEATQIIEQTEQRGGRPSLKAALEQAGIRPFKSRDSERQLRQIGRERARQLNQWLLDADLAMKGHNSPPGRARIELERLIVRLSTHASSRHGPA